MNIIELSRRVGSGADWMHAFSGEFDEFDTAEHMIFSDLMGALRAQIHPMLLTVPPSCLDGGMRAAIDAYKAGVAALQGEAK